VTEAYVSIRIVTDTNILINLIQAQVLDLLGRLDGYEFVVVDQVEAEITWPDQVDALRKAIEAGWLRREAISSIEGLSIFADLVRVMGRGEAACLALAQTQNWSVASDEKKLFRRQALARLGQGRILTTAGLIVLAIRANLLTVEQADQIKLVLETKRFRMEFGSFRDIVT
jgi:predicted nucleic acid-binding protein